MNCIGTPPTYPSNNTLAITDSGANIHLEDKPLQQWPKS